MDTADYISGGAIFVMFFGMVVFTYYKYRTERETDEQYKQRQEHIAATLRASRNNNSELQRPQ